MNQGYSGRGDWCQPEISCIDDETICDVNANCHWEVAFTGSYYKCRCNDGFEGDGHQCKRNSFINIHDPIFISYHCHVIH